MLNAMRARLSLVGIGQITVGGQVRAGSAALAVFPATWVDGQGRPSPPEPGRAQRNDTTLPGGLEVSIDDVDHTVPTQRHCLVPILNFTP